MGYSHRAGYAREGGLRLHNAVRLANQANNEMLAVGPIITTIQKIIENKCVVIKRHKKALKIIVC